MSTHYCRDCGQPVSVREVEGRPRKYCLVCDQIQYRNAKPCAGVCVVDGDSVLLIKRTIPPDAGAWSLPAGYLEVDEPPEQGAVRELAEETTLRTMPQQLTLHDTVLVAHPAGHRVLVIVYTTPRAATTGIPTAGADAAAARFWNPETLVASDTDRVETGYEDVFRAVVDSVSD